MGCVSSKQVANSSLTLADSSKLHNPNSNHNRNCGLLEKNNDETGDGNKISNEDPATKWNDAALNDYSDNKHSKKPSFTFSVRFGRSTVAEHVAAGWPAWLSASAGEAIDGWIPQKSDSFERFEKIGQGTYSNVYRARDLKTGRMVALKKVRFDNSQPESVRFMAREITILRKLDHPNVMKLEGIITSRLSSNIYLVFNYMEHDLAGLISSPHIRFTDCQIKCYMRQLLKGIEHLHSRGIVHRDMKTSNILVNNEGQLKIADFGLANFVSSRQPLTSRVVTLWYRPPELLLGSTSYGTCVDMWSLGCVFAELFIRRPILKGRTEVEQLHKIFMLCGTPPNEYWNKPTLPLAKTSKPRHAYHSSIRKQCKEVPTTAMSLLESFLSVESEKRASATSALQSEYFRTRPFACDPASLPQYPPCKEIDAKFRDRKKDGGRLRASLTSRNLSRGRKSLLEQTEARRSAYFHGPGGVFNNYGTSSEISQTADVSQADTISTLPALATTSNGTLGWSTKGRKHVSFLTPTSQNVRSIEPSYERVTTATHDLSSDHRTNGRRGAPRSRFSKEA